MIGDIHYRNDIVLADSAFQLHRHGVLKRDPLPKNSYILKSHPDLFLFVFKLFSIALIYLLVIL